MNTAMWTKLVSLPKMPGSARVWPEHKAPWAEDLAGRGSAFPTSCPRANRPVNTLQGAERVVRGQPKVSEQEAGAAEGRRSRTQISHRPFPRTVARECSCLRSGPGEPGGTARGRASPTGPPRPCSILQSSLSGPYVFFSSDFTVNKSPSVFFLRYLLVKGLKIIPVLTAVVGAQPCGPSWG